jgi:MFS family permease
MTTARERRRVARAFLLMSGLDYFADFILSVTAMLLLQARGFSSGAVFAMIAAVWITEAVFEIPTGVIADMIGRRRSVLISLVLRTLGYSALFFSSRVEVAVIGMLLAAVGTTFWSGALEAWAVDETGELEPGETLDRLLSRARLAENAGLVAGTMTGALLGSVSLALPQLIAGAVCGVGAMMGTAWMTERRHAPVSLQGTAMTRIWASTREVASGTRQTLVGDKVLLGLLLAGAMFWAFRGIPGVQWTVHFGHVGGAGLFVVAAMRCTSSLLEIPVLMGVMRLQARGRRTRGAIIATAATTGAVLLLVSALISSPSLGVAAYMGYSLCIGICMPGLRAAINERLDSRHRATALSVSSLLNALLTGAGLVIVGNNVGDLANIGYSWPTAAAGLVIAAAILTVLTSLAPSRPTVIDAEPDLGATGEPPLAALPVETVG